jgi:glycosyltransferase involved in cell wall biosynthesis
MNPAQPVTSARIRPGILLAVPRHDVAIYMPWAGEFYDEAAGHSGGGAERQTWLLAHDLARRGLRVAHIVYPVRRPVTDPAAPVTLVTRPRQRRPGATAALASETVEVWRALTEADASVVVFRGATGAFGVGALWARAHHRHVVFAGANNSDFTLGAFSGPKDPRAVLFRAGLRLADEVVVQSGDQVDLARQEFTYLHSVEQIASFVEPAPETTEAPEAFLWVSRLVDYKRPQLYADLAAAVPEARFWMIGSESSLPAVRAAREELAARAAQLPNLELLPQRPHAELQELMGRAIAIVNTSSFEGMPNTWLEGWARGVPALTLSFDPDGRIARNGLGVAAGGDWDAFVAATRSLWERRADRGGLGPAVRAYVADVHGEQVGAHWADVVERLAALNRTGSGARPGR